MNDLVLLHGIGTGPEAWAPQVDAFSSTRRVLTPRVSLDLGRAVEALQAVDAARLDLCGLAWGALVALRFALEEPARVRRLAVCAGFASLPRALRALQYALSLAGRELARPMRQGARFDVRRQITSLEPPLLVLCGERDRVNRPLSRGRSRYVCRKRTSS
jgi:pimeloyl-ACP methyl ester carboxylesterase